ncbi:hypothetical protein FDP41_008329 [Naegleria fowleri]|uniref:Calcineurin-like phosphoesterase domain-containing protein n=1 Tax=Naegleria fowleri TaxID=5763 RepID=A0A6A5BIT2_NAEFO|nr:uncharacterized protein FDP41_008329 [Naegleria fowleri]KAF0973625.1 hypothetical protein FDP41_008329 [Naegleria fowleri]CAG4708382.1 unnamed protein product [Naegleria fowleri]
MRMNGLKLIGSLLIIIAILLIQWHHPYTYVCSSQTTNSKSISITSTQEQESPKFPYASSHHNSDASDSVRDYFVWITDVHYDPLYDDSIPARNFCRPHPRDNIDGGSFSTRTPRTTPSQQNILARNYPLSKHDLLIIEQIEKEFHEMRKMEEKEQSFRYLEEKRKKLEQLMREMSSRGGSSRGHYRQYQPSSLVSLQKTKFGKYGCDAPISLVQSTFQKIGQVIKEEHAKDPDFILMTGDYNAHHLKDAQQALLNIRDVTRMMQQEIGRSVSNIQKIPILPCIGNNDLFPDYYLPFIEDPDNGSIALKWYDQLWNEPVGWSQLFGLNETHQRETFLRGGYYKYELKKVSHGGQPSKMVILVLNSLLYSMNRWPEMRNGQMPADPSGQFQWLQNELLNVKKQHEQGLDISVFIATHIPAAQNSYDDKQLWEEEYLEKFLNLIQPFSMYIRSILYGHLHKDEFRVLVSKSRKNLRKGATHTSQQNSQINNDDIYGMIGLSVSTVFSNNPGFRVLYYNSQGTIQDYDQYFMDLYSSNQLNQALWKKEYSFSLAYPSVFENEQCVTPRTISNLLKTMKDPNFTQNEKDSNNNTMMTTLMKYLSYYTGMYIKDRYKYYCEFDQLDETSFLQCINNGTDSGSSLW